MSLLLAELQGIEFERMLTFFPFFPTGYGVSLPWIYVLWVMLVLMLYPFCWWLAALKRRRNDWWLSYL